MRVSDGTCSRIRLTIAFIASTPSSAERPRSGAVEACADRPRKRNLPVTLASVLDALDGVAIAGMPRHHGVDVVEQTGAQHVDLARAAFFGGRAVEAQRAAALVGGQPVLDGDRRGGRGGAEQVMAAAMSRAVRSTSGLRSGSAACDSPGSASNSPTMPITGLPLPQVATNAVGISATPAVDVEAGAPSAAPAAARCSSVS